MDKFIEYLLPKITTKKVIITTIVAIIIITILFPYIDSNYFLPNRINSRIEVLDKITKLDMTKIEESPELFNEYNDILLEIDNASNNKSLNFFRYNKKSNDIWKFISGAILFWVLIPFTFFIKSNQDKKKSVQIIYKILAAILIFIVGMLFGFIASIIPIIINKWVNYIGFPLLLVLIIVLIAYKSEKSSN